MPSLSLTSFRTAIAEAVFEGIAAADSSLYFFAGRPQAWDGMDEDVETPVNTIPYLNTVRQSMVYLKKIYTSDCKFMVPKHDWTDDTVFDQYDDSYGATYAATTVSSLNSTLSGSFDITKFGEGWLVEGTGISGDTHVVSATTTTIELDKDIEEGAEDIISITLTNVSTSGAEDLADSDFYVVTAENNVYKCLDNAQGGLSTVEPTLVQEEPFGSIDGYRWKYLFTVPTSHMDEFGTTTMIPIGDPIGAAGTGIHNIKVMHKGSGYTSLTTTVTVTGDGTGCTAEAVIGEDLAIESIQITEPGTGYTYASVTVESSLTGSGGVLRAIVAPPGGHGTNPVRELCSYTLRLSKVLSFDELVNGLPAGNDYRQTGLIKDPLIFGDTTKYQNYIGTACFTIAGPFSYADVNEDDIIFDTDGKRYRIVSKPAEEPEEDVDLLVQALDNSTPIVGQTIEYAETNAIISEVTSPNIDKYSGMILYVDNRLPYQPSEDQLISFKSTLSF